MAIAAMTAVEARISAIQQRFTAPSSLLIAATSGRVAPGAAGGASGSAAFEAEVARASGALAAPGTAGAAAAAAGPGAARVGGEDVVAVAKEYLGVPYVLGGNGPAEGLDCSGLTELVYRRFGIDLPPVSWEQITSGRPVNGLANARPGDLVFFGRPTSHVGIYAGDGTMVHAPRPGKSVEVAKVYETPTAIRRILPDPPAAAAPASPATTAGARLAPASAAPLVPALAAYAGTLGAVPFAEQFRAAEHRHGVPARVLSAVAKAESGYRADATSPAGARGVMQFMPATAQALGVDPLDPASAIDGAARLLRRHVAEFGSLPLALAAYNAGEGAVRRAGGIPAYAETRTYVTKIMSMLGGTA